MKTPLIKAGCFAIMFAVLASAGKAQVDSNAKMQWFADAKLGIFIHWGVYSVDGTSESWAFHNRHLSHEKYMAQIHRFGAEKYRPEAWVALIKQSGAQYAVITSKHHDGVALWKTAMNHLSIPDSAPAGRDVLTPFVDELRKANLKVGLYYSLIDWSYPDYPGFLRDSSRYAISKDTARWGRFLGFCHGQIDELMSLYKPDLVWFDGDWEHSAEEWKAKQIRETILHYNPQAIINSRLAGYGDYSTPEQNFPITRPELKYWELCMTMNDSWGYYPTDSNYKTPYEIISIFADVISMGGNLLLDIGPKADGTLPPEQVYILQEIGNWTGKHREAIFGTLAGLPQGHYYGPSTVSADSSCIYLFLPGKPTGEIVIKGLDSKIKRVSVIGQKDEPSWKIVGKISWSRVPGLVYISLDN